MKLSMSSEMGIHAVWYLAHKEFSAPVQASILSNAIGASETYLTKVLHKLADAGVLRSKKGKLGGFSLGRSPEDISLADIVSACEAEEPLYSCQRESRLCTGDLAVCPICISLGRARELLFTELAKTRVSDLVEFGWRVPEGP